MTTLAPGSRTDRDDATPGAVALRELQIDDAALEDAIRNGPPAGAGKRQSLAPKRKLPWWLSRWISRAVVVIGLVATIATAGYIAHRPGTYWSEVHVVFLAPLSAQNPNSLQAGSVSLIVFAGVIAQEVGSSAPITTVSDSVSLVSAGVKHGYQVRLPNDGGQWANNFDQQLLDVQATGSTQAEVSQTMTTVLAKIQTAVTTMQADDDVKQVNLIYTSQSPPNLPLYYTAPSAIRAVAGVCVLGIGLTVAAAGIVRRRRRTWTDSAAA